MNEFTRPSGVGQLASISEQSAKQPEVILPKEGDIMRIAVTPWGHFSVIDENTIPQKDHKVLEVEVKAIKSVKVSYE